LTYTITQRLIAKGADVNAKNKNVATPLYSAAYFGHKDVAELLIAKGADVNAKNKYGFTCDAFYRDPCPLFSLILISNSQGRLCPQNYHEMFFVWRDISRQATKLSNLLSANNCGSTHLAPPYPIWARQI
jgi:hypothetical protein